LNVVLSVPTVMICVAITVLIVAVALTLVWIHDQREKAVLWWAVGMWSAVLGASFLATRTLLPLWLAVGIGVTLMTLAFGLVAAGFSVFTGGRANTTALAAGPMAWLASYLLIPGFTDIVAYRAMVTTVILGCYCLLIVGSAWRGWKEERLPTFLATVLIYSTHCVFCVVRTLFAIFIPATEQGGDIQAVWVAAVALEAFTMSIFSTFVFLALIKERAERKYRLAAEIDSLTNSATRRFFVSETRDRLVKAPKSGVLAIIDLDFFKSVNDCYGHLGGDRVLQAFGKFVNSRLEPGMIFGRLGGEEFGLFLRDKELSEAREFLEQLRADVEAMQIPFMGSPIRITISIGAASVREVGIDFDHLMAAADSALYLAKEEGRNRLRTFSLTMRMHQIVEDGSEMRLGTTEQRLSRVNIRSRIGGA
jgi:diguanylate cyclase (GGDEF)-like protein